MRLTINLDEDLYAMARSHAIAGKTSISKAVCDLLRRRTAPSPPSGSVEASSYFDPVLGFEVSRSQHPLNLEMIQASMDDEDRSKVELFGRAKSGQP